MGIQANHSNLKWKNVYAFLQSKWIKIYKSIFPISTHREEQELYREYIAKTNQYKCWEKGECPCECAIRDVILSDPGCDKNCFGPMLDKAAWNNFKIKNQLTINLEQKIVC